MILYSILIELNAFLKEKVLRWYTEDAIIKKSDMNNHINKYLISCQNFEKEKKNMQKVNVYVWNTLMHIVLWSYLNKCWNYIKIKIGSWVLKPQK